MPAAKKQAAVADANNPNQAAGAPAKAAPKMEIDYSKLEQAFKRALESATVDV